MRSYGPQRGAKSRGGHAAADDLEATHGARAWPQSLVEKGGPASGDLDAECEPGTCCVIVQLHYLIGQSE